MVNTTFKLKEIRNKPESNLKVIEKISRIFLSSVFGLLLGLLAKYLDGTNLGIIGSMLGIWVFIATILAVYSRSPLAGALHVLSFFVCMLIYYYIYSIKFIGFFPKTYFLYWGIIALLSPIGAYIIWYGKGNGLFSAIIASLPISILLWEGYSFFYTLSLYRGFDIILSIILLFIMSSNKKQAIRVVIISIMICIAIVKLNILGILGLAV